MSVYETLLKLFEANSQLAISDILKGLQEAGYLKDSEYESLLNYQQTPKASSIFISYRRQDSRWFTRQLFQNLEEEFPGLEIFWDLELALGEDFTEAIENAVNKSSVLLAVIGNSWLQIRDENGLRRLDNPYDYVRFEIATALKRQMLVIPILIDKTPMPASKDLPEDLQGLIKRQALEVDEKRFRHDLAVLFNQIQTFMGKA